MIPMILILQIVCGSDYGVSFPAEVHGYVVAPHIVLDSSYAHDLTLHAKDVIILPGSSLERVEIFTYDCNCDDQLIPGISVLGDSCIRDDEWMSGGYADVLTDSAAFFTENAMQLFDGFGVKAYDDCLIDSFYVKELEIVPPGGVDRPSGSREFRILLRAVDAVGRAREALMVWIRNEGCD